MYLVNTSFIVENNVLPLWLNEMKERVIPSLTQNNVNVVAFSRVISVEPVEAFTYSLLVQVADITQYELYTKEVLAQYLDALTMLHDSKIMWFTTLMKKELL